MLNVIWPRCVEIDCKVHHNLWFIIRNWNRICLMGKMMFSDNVCIIFSMNKHLVVMDCTCVVFWIE